MAIKTDKPQDFTDTDIAAFEANPKNKSRGKVLLAEFPSDETPDVPARFWLAKPNRQQLEIITETNTSKGIGAANDLVLNTAILAGDVAQLEDDDALYFGLIRVVSELNEAKKKI